MWEKIYYWILWLRGRVVRVKLYSDEDESNFFVDRELFERFREAAHKEHGTGENAINRAIEEGIELALAFEEGPESLNALRALKKPGAKAGAEEMTKAEEIEDA